MQLQHTKISMCFSALVFGPFYFFYRKAWKPAFGFLAAELVVALPTLLSMMQATGSPLTAGISSTAIVVLSRIMTVFSFALVMLRTLYAKWLYRKSAAERIRRIRAEHPDVDLVIMDDGFQHRYVEPKVNIVMIDATRPVQHDRMLPLGTLRDLPEELHRAHYFVVTKCPEKMAPIDRRILRKVLIQVAYQRVYFTRFESFMPQPLFPDAAPGEPLLQGQQVIALSGIGSPKPFLAALRGSYGVVAEMTLDDHHVYKVRDLNRLRELLDKFPGAVIVTTEKDAVKLTNRAKIPEEIQRRIYYLPINISFIEDSATDFLQKLEEDVRGN